MRNHQLIGILGGTFDPIHNGHLHVATSVLKELPLDQIRLLPCYQPAFQKIPSASPEHRLIMTKLACDSLPKISVDEHEIHRQGSSFMIDTLRTLKKEQPDDYFCLIIGQDALASFDQWHEWEQILNYCHLIVVNRPINTTEINSGLQSFIIQHKTDDFSALLNSHSGKIFFCEIPALDISATRIRTQLKQHQNVENTIPHAVIDYILKHHLYEN
jgi:nicotinate-nucleotide adenylyltransferase